MRCPRASCNSSRTKVLHTYKSGRPGGDLITRELRGLNVSRRLYECLECEKRFATVEMLESDFDDMKRPPGRLETPRITIRKGATRGN